MLGAFFRAIGQLEDKAVQRVFWIALIFAVVVFVIVWAVVGKGVAALAQFDDPTWQWLSTPLEWLGFLAVPFLSWIIFPAAMNIVIAWLLDDVAEAVENRHYPALPPPEEPPFLDVVWAGLRLMAKMIGLNLLILPFLFLLPPVFPFVFYAVNGYLLGREYFELAAQRRAGKHEIERMRTAHRREVFFAGVTTAVLLTVPIVNLVAPVVATAAMVHLVEAWRTKSPVST